jgi:hypothetical protein
MEIKPNSTANMFGVATYTEPQCFKYKNYKKDKKSDIYSLGILLWEISSGYPPSSHISEIILGQREEPIKGTPQVYQQLYQECWDDNPEKRPNIDQVYKVLNQFNANDTYKSNNNNDSSSKLNIYSNSSSDLYLESKRF